ncbi:macrolide 2'-phosphotransferase [Nocardia farcinica]|uniref:macrolide 2'-phosphotransferase n=1 Tax=Nocardia farcinica TaxID=37329 RepID=UPI0024540FA1|nr:macrolide 2'-phosphotransferase [Nocardia farcinica]
MNNTGTKSSAISERLLGLARNEGLRIDPRSVSIDDSGWDFHVLRGKDFDDLEWIVRVPKRDSMASRIQAERKLLSLVNGKLPAAVPEWRICTGQVIAYPCLTGDPAAQDTGGGILRWSIDKENPPASYTDSLGACMAALHAVPVKDAKLTGIPYSDPENLRDALKTKLDRAVSEIGMHPSWVERCQRWLDNEALWPDRTVLIHGDMHPGHALVNEVGTITGVLDWTDAEIGDPGQEFIEACRKFPPHVLDEVLTAYQRSGGKIWPGLRSHISEGIAFAPMFLGVLGLDSDQPTYVDRARIALSSPTR